MIFALLTDGSETEINGEVYHDPEDGVSDFDIMGCDYNQYPENIKLIYDRVNQVGVHFHYEWHEFFFCERGFKEHLEKAKQELQQ